MADIFISYSKQDRQQVHFLAAYLESEGYSVWWDTSLLGGEDFRKVIMTELGRARAVIVIWTKNSIQSDWVQSEAGRGHADHRLIPVKTNDVSYRDIPPPFDNMHTEDITSRDKILGAVVALLSKPQALPSHHRQIWKSARFELLSWFGVVGAVLTITTNLNGLLIFSKWVMLLLESWSALLTHAWSTILFFLPPVHAQDAVMLTFITFAAINLVMSCSRKNQFPMTKRHILSIVVASFILAFVFLAGLTTAPPNYERFSYVGWLVGNFDQLSLKMLSIDRWEDAHQVSRWIFGSFVIFVLLIVFAPPLALLLSIYTATWWIAKVRLRTEVLSIRLWQIVIGVTLVFALNLGTLWIEGRLNFREPL